MLLVVRRKLCTTASRNAVLISCYGWFLCYLVGVPFGKLGPIQGVALPTLVAATAVSLVDEQNNKPIPFAHRNLWIATALFPFCMRIVVHVTYRIQNADDTLRFVDVISLVLNTTAKAAVMAMGPLLVVAPSASQVWLHAALGVFVVVAGCGHGLGYLGGFLVLRGNLLHMTLPPLACWDPSNTVGSMDCGGHYRHCTCYSILVNFYGVLAVCCMGLLSLSSLPYIRRNFYTTFYNIHIFTSPIIALILCFHYKRSMVYMAGGILVYAARRLPEIVEHWLRRRLQQPVRILAMDVIPCRGDDGCIALTVAATSSTAPCGHNVRLLVPSISRVAHPFSVISTSDRPGQLRLLVRCCGPFTRRLASDLPILAPAYLHGYYSSSGSTFERLASQHDAVVFIVGGIGITAVLGWIAEQQHHATKTIVLHWACRDPALISYVLDTWFPESLKTSRLEIRVVVHHTGGKSLSDGAEVRSVDCSAMVGQPWTPTNHETTTTSLVWIGWTGLLVAVVAYEQLQVKKDLRSRLWSPALTVAWLLVATALLHVLRTRQWATLLAKTGKENRGEDEDDNEGEALWIHKDTVGDVETESEEEFELGSIHQRHPLGDATDGSPSLTNMEIGNGGVEHREGRPTIGEILEDVPGGQVGVVVCGPASLADYVRKNLPGYTICKGMRASTAVRYTLYEESFEP